MDVAALEATQRNIKLSINAPEAVDFIGDRGELDIILNNLITNAVKYNRDNGTVTVDIKPMEGKVQIKVSDTGIGIDPEDVKRLFNDFVRIKNEKTINILGSGLGLSTVKKLVSLYNGKVSLDSTLDVGSTFTVEISSAVLGPDQINK